MRANELVPGVWQLRTSMTGHSFGGTNSYLLTSDSGAVLIDTPWGTPEVIDSLVAGIRATGTEPADVRRVLITHYHEDHSGAAGWFSSEHGSEIIMHAADANAFRGRFRAAGEPDGNEFGSVLDSWLDRIGIDDAGRSFAHRQYRRLSPLAHPMVPDRLVGDGDRIDAGDWSLEAIHTPGHTAGHLCFVERRRGLLFAGDHVFARRRSNATARPYCADRPIARYWESTRKLLATTVTTVLPGHEEPFDDLPARMRRLSEVRDRKLAEVVELAAASSTVWQLAQRVRRSRHWTELDANATLAAAGETLAYLLEARDRGWIRSDGGTPEIWSADGSSGPHDVTSTGRRDRVEPVL